MISYDDFTKAFLSKIKEFEFRQYTEELRQEIVDSYMKRAISLFKRLCKYDLIGTADDENRVFNTTIDAADYYEIIDIISEGMVVCWLQPYANSQDLIENSLNTKDWSSYSPAELLMRMSDAYYKASNKYVQAMREYSYNVGDLRALHL